MVNSSGKKKIVVTRDDGVRKEFTYNTSRGYLYVSSGSRTYRRYLKEGARTDDAVTAAAIRLILDNFGG